MAYTPVMPNMKLTAQDMGQPDYHQAMMRGFEGLQKAQEAAVRPQSLTEKLLEMQLANKINKPKAEHAEESESLGRQLQRAQINKANRGPATVYSNLEKAMQGYDRIKQQYGEGSEQANQARNYVQRLAEGTQGLQLTTDPTTGALTSLSFGGSGRGAPKSILTTDSEGNKVVVTQPTTPQTTATQKASLSEIGRSTIAKEAEMPYVGTGSNAAIIQDRVNYENGDKEAGKRLVQAAVAAMISPEYAGFQLTSQGVNPTVESLKHQYKTIQQGWPKSAELIVENLPPELQKEAKAKHAALLAKIKEAKEQHAAKGYPVKVGGNTNNKILKYNVETGRLE